MQARIYEILSIQFLSIVNLIQMRLITVIDKMKSILNRTYQHCEDPKLIQVSILKMHAIQFVPRVNLIQVWLMKVISNLKNILIQELPVVWNQDWLKWWRWKCFRFYSCQTWIWFKCDWWKWLTWWKTFQSNNFNIAWNHDWLKW
jgi:hypothetical protein